MEYIWWFLHSGFLFMDKRWHFVESSVYIPDVKTILATSPKRCKYKFKKHIEKRFLSDIYWCPKIIGIVVLGTWVNNKHHNTVEFFVSFVSKTSINLSKVYTRSASDEAVILYSFFKMYYLTRHTNLMADKRFSLFDECATLSVPDVIYSKRMHLFFLRDQ